MIEFFIINENKKIQIPLNTNYWKMFYQKENLSKNLIQQFLKNKEYKLLKKEITDEFISNIQCAANNNKTYQNEIIISIPKTTLPTFKNEFFKDFKNIELEVLKYVYEKILLNNDNFNDVNDIKQKINNTSYLHEILSKLLSKIALLKAENITVEDIKILQNTVSQILPSNRTKISVNSISGDFIESKCRIEDQINNNNYYFLYTFKASFNKTT